MVERPESFREPSAPEVLDWLPLRRPWWRGVRTDEVVLVGQSAVLLWLLQRGIDVGGALPAILEVLAGSTLAISVPLLAQAGAKLTRSRHRLTRLRLRANGEVSLERQGRRERESGRLRLELLEDPKSATLVLGVVGGLPPEHVSVADIPNDTLRVLAGVGSKASRSEAVDALRERTLRERARAGLPTRDAAEVRFRGWPAAFGGRVSVPMQRTLRASLVLGGSVLLAGLLSLVRGAPLPISASLPLVLAAIALALAPLPRQRFTLRRGEGGQRGLRWRIFGQELPAGEVEAMALARGTSDERVVELLDADGRRLCRAPADAATVAAVRAMLATPLRARVGDVEDAAGEVHAADVASRSGEEVPVDDPALPGLAAAEEWP